MLSPRLVPSRDDKYMGLAHVVASFSKDPHTQVGAVIVDHDNRPLGWGYNGPPHNISDNAIDWERPFKYDFIKHAEDNAIDHSCGSVALATLYVTAKPCKKCMLRIVDSGLKNVVYFPYKSLDVNSSLSKASDSEKADEIAKLGGVKLCEFQGNINWIKDWVEKLKVGGVFF